MSTLADLVPIPAVSSMNPGLSACREETMLEKFGRPGPLSRNCSPPTLPFKRRIRSGVSVGPFSVSGLDYAVDSLEQIFTTIRNSHPDVYAEVKTAGMLCVRARRHNPAHYSNHSWGCAIDLYFGTHLVSQGVHMTQRGFLALYPVFNANGWYWGAEFSGSSVDSMHFELADQTIRNIPDARVGGPELVAAADYIADVGYDQIVDEEVA